MARMYPSTGPVANQSRYAEPLLYHALATQLSQEFVVIHSLPWLAQVAKSVDGRSVPTGEVDFLVLHPSLGILAIEVKGGKIAFEGNVFFVQRTGQIIDPINQVRKSVHGLAHWIAGAGGPRYRLGYAIAFPECTMQGRNVPPALIDTTGDRPHAIYIDQHALEYIEPCILEIMHYWRQALDLWPLGEEGVQQVIDLLCPSADYTPLWKDRIQADTTRWLVLTPQQSRVLERFQHQERILLSGRSGTGKTLLAMTYARHLAESGKRVLFLVYNALLADDLRWALKGLKQIRVIHYHDLCREAIRILGALHRIDGDWFNVEAPASLAEAIVQKKMPEYDALVLDEAQVLKARWVADLEQWFSNKPVLACCDETQVFPFEQRTCVHELEEILHTQAFTLTVNARSPYVIFERLQNLLPSPYEQVSLRPEETDALQEMITPDPLATLCAIIRQLHAEGVSSSELLVIYTGKNPPKYPKVELPFIPTTYSVYRSRGLEAPVVIVWNSQEIEDSALLCAYSRATSRCIAIYNAAFLETDKARTETDALKSTFLSFLSS